MTDPGLSNRLRQHSRRAGLMVGVSMAFTIAICIGGFAVVYAGLAPFLSDLVAMPIPTATHSPPPGGGAVARVERTPPSQPTPASREPTPVAQPTPTSAAFVPTHQISASQSVNLRPDPSTSNPAILALSPGTPLQYLNEDAPTSNPASDGRRWMRFRTEQGQVGWVREIDTEPYQR